MHVVANKEGVRGNAAVVVLQQVAKLQVLQVRLKTKVVVCWVRYGVFANSMTEHVTQVAGRATCAVVHGARCATGAAAHFARNDGVTRGIFVRTGTAPQFLHVKSKLVILTAVQDGEREFEPVTQGPKNTTPRK